MSIFRKRYFEWIDGEQQGIVETLNNITCVDGEYFYNFASGEACNARFISRMTRTPGDLRGKVMVEIMSPNDPWTFKEVGMGKFKDSNDNIIEYPPLEDITGASGQGESLDVSQSALGKKKKVPPRYSGELLPLPSIDDYFVDEEANLPKTTRPRPTPAPVQKPAPPVQAPAPDPEPQPAPAPVPQVQPAPVPQQATVKEPENVFAYQQIEREHNDAGPVEIVAKACKKVPTDINLTITLDLPGKSVFDMVNTEFENGGPIFVDYLISKIDINSIIRSLRDSILDAYMGTPNDDGNENAEP